MTLARGDLREHLESIALGVCKLHRDERGDLLLPRLERHYREFDLLQPDRYDLEISNPSRSIVRARPADLQALRRTFAYPERMEEGKMPIVP
jgi:hypothetical protein